MEGRIEPWQLRKRQRRKRSKSSKRQKPTGEATSLPQSFLCSASRAEGALLLVDKCELLPGRAIESNDAVLKPAQFAVACAFAVQTMRVTFDQIDSRAEQVALTLGCRRSQAFLQIALPQAWRGIIAALTIAWARSLGEFGPILVFAGATRMRTEVLSTTVFLELSVGQGRSGAGTDKVLGVVAEMAEIRTIRKLHAKSFPLARCPHVRAKGVSQKTSPERLGFYPFRGPAASLTLVR